VAHITFLERSKNEFKQNISQGSVTVFNHPPERQDRIRVLFCLDDVSLSQVDAVGFFTTRLELSA
jgi:hypothetical protein